MTGWRAAATGLGAAAAMTGAIVVLHARDAGGPLQEPAERVLYLSPGRTAARAFLAFDDLASDVYWMRAIQHYGRDRKSSRTTNRFALLQPLLELTTTLDPRFTLAYRFGAIFLSMDPPDGPGRPDQAIALLQKGLSASPGRWQYAYDIGFVHYWYTGRMADAAYWFQRAALMPHAPAWLRPLAAVTMMRGGDRAGARQLLHELQHSSEPYLRQEAERRLAQIDARDALDALQSIVDRYRARTGHRAAGWSDLIRAGDLGEVPIDPAGTTFVLDRTTSRVGLAPASPLAPLPKGLPSR